MKNLMKFMAVLLFTVATYSAATAQTLKFGHIDLQALVQVMPERAAAEAEFAAFQQEVGEIFTDLQNDYQTKLAEYEALGEAASEIKINAKIAEIQDVNTRMQNYEETARQQLQKKENEVLGPVFDKAESAIDEVAKEQGLIYVFNSGAGSGSILYKSNQSVDLLPLVKTKLGIQ